MGNIESINIHAFTTDDDGNALYCDSSDTIPDGWCVYLRTPTDACGEFDIPDEWDFTNLEAATQWAAQLSAQYSAPIDFY